MNSKVEMTEEEIEKDAVSAAKNHTFDQIKDVEKHIALVYLILKDEK